MTQSFFEASKITKKFDQDVIFSELDFSIGEGEILSIVGPSGSGKTTLLRCIAGLDMLTSGEIAINTKRVDTEKVHRRPVGYVFQQPLMFPHMTVAENINYGTKLKKTRSRAEELLKAIDLEGYGDKYPYQLSGGEQQRVALARALAVEPDLLLLDEPFSSLDPKLRKGLRIWMKDFLKQQGMTSIFVTHDHEEAMMMGDRMGIFNDGKFHQLDHPEALYHEPADEFVAEFIGGQLILDNKQYVPLQSCRLLHDESDNEQKDQMYKGEVRYITIQNNIRFASVYLTTLDRLITLPVTESVGEHQRVTVTFPQSAVRLFGEKAGARNEA
ncbi:heme ABC exporter ATP-binding protein CcmA [Thalassobacillus hwangdonensis]|uniref:Heme ABC exporter ATP-binding protein CcmA n=1 Tax=Thalassobacillus hwangdonensis TaxID=546108 RepID=A0ABW3L2Q2_9BACI